MRCWGYGFCEIDAAIEAILARSLLAPIDPFWAEGNQLTYAPGPSRGRKPSRVIDSGLAILYNHISKAAS